MANTEFTPAAPEGEDAESKQPQAAVAYRMGNPMRSCGLCGHFTGSAGEGAYQCETVDGEISPYGYCDIYERQDNPFLPGTQASFTDTEGPEENAAPEEEPEPPRLQIGNRSY
jgi:hypothetical protein